MTMVMMMDINEERSVEERCTIITLVVDAHWVSIGYKYNIMTLWSNCYYLFITRSSSSVFWIIDLLTVFVVYYIIINNQHNILFEFTMIPFIIIYSSSPLSSSRSFLWCIKKGTCVHSSLGCRCCVQFWGVWFWGVQFWG